MRSTEEGRPGEASEQAIDLLRRLRDSLADRYELEAVLGRGTIASTLLARDRKHGRGVVLRVLNPDLSAAVEGQRFLREVNTIAGLSHPHILTLIDSGEADGLFYYVVPHVEGESLRSRLERERQLPVGTALGIAIDVADGLDHAHRRGIIHRDITPETILISEGHATIADFGVARAIDSAGSDRLTAIGVTVGTPAYSSPEQLRDDPALDGRSDVYSLGCVMYEMLTGAPPLAGQDTEELIRRRLQEDPPSARSARGTVPPLLDDVIRRALARLPADRFETAAELHKELRNIRLAPPGTAWALGTMARETEHGRRLAAIVCIDVVGYSRLVEADEKGTLARVRTLRTELVEPAIKRHYGRIVKHLGDGLLAEFQSAVDAVVCSTTIQRAMQDRSGEAPDAQRILLRIGINVGDIVAEDGDIFGDGVNVAARVEGLSEPGGVALSGSAWDQVHNKLDLEFEDLGTHLVKNLRRPIRVYRVRAAGVTAADGRPRGSPGLRSRLGRVFGSLGGG